MTNEAIVYAESYSGDTTLQYFLAVAMQSDKKNILSYFNHHEYRFPKLHCFRQDSIARARKNCSHPTVSL